MEDLDIGAGLREVRLADGRVMLLSQVSLPGLCQLKGTRLRPTAGLGTLTWSSAIPAGARVAGVTSEITRAFGTSQSLTAFAIGDATLVDRWGVQSTLTPPAQTDQSTFTTGDWRVFTGASDIIVSAQSGLFDASGELELTLHYFLLTHRSA